MVHVIGDRLHHPGPHAVGPEALMSVAKRGATEIGQGCTTVLAQIAAEEKAVGEA